MKIVVGKNTYGTMTVKTSHGKLKIQRGTRMTPSIITEIATRKYHSHQRKK